jgi:hypothetical protein
MRVRAAAIAALAAMGLAGAACGRDEYPASVKRAFIENCERTSGGNTEFCECALDEVQENLSLEEFNKEETAIIAGAPPSRKLTDAAAECRE